MKVREVKAAVEKKLNSPSDFLYLTPIGNRDHFMYKLYFKKKYIGLFQLSYGSREFGPESVGRMSRQLGIASRQLKEMVSCTFWGRDFIKTSRLIV